MPRSYWPIKRKLQLRLLLCLVAFAAGHTTSFGQSQTQYLYWIRYQNQLNFSEKISWNNEADNRRFFNPDVANQFIAHSRLHYKTGRWDHAVGITASWIFTQVPENGYTGSTLELRPVVETNYELPFPRWSLQNRVRIDNRFFEANEQQNIFEASTYVLRLRYRILARIPIKFYDDGKPRVNVRVANEIMINHRENTFDQNRVYLNTDIVLTPALTFDVGYVCIYQQRFGRQDFFERHVLRFTLLHKIMLY